ncbi:MAG: esterase-like activity of phytase family protein [Ferruginibacter sp.]
MGKTSLRLFSLIVIVCTFNSCDTVKKSASSKQVGNITSLHFINEYDLPYNLRYNNTTVGGLSGIDRNVENGQYLLISDDRSAIEPARFYTARILISSKGIDSVYFTAVNNLLQANGQTYPNNKQDKFHVPDPEAARYYAPFNQIIWSSEGERIVNKNDTVLEDPSINVIAPNGKFISSFQLPSVLKMQSIPMGPRQNGVLEGMTFDDNFKTLYANVEEPLYEDGPRADTFDNNAFIRILRFNMPGQQLVKQYAYKLDPVAQAPNPADAFKINGVPDILAIGNGKLLVIERSFSTGRMACTIKIFIADVSNATDIKNVAALKDNNNFKPASKKLLLNMDDLGIFIDNIEGVTFGPDLPNGHKSLLFISDNNFNPLEKTQFLLFEILN